MNEVKLSVEGLEKERDFYFRKVAQNCLFICTFRAHTNLSQTLLLQLREIEIIVGTRLESNPLPEEDDVLKQVQAVLYSTEVLPYAVQR